jgi:hypothetical protein
VPVSTLANIKDDNEYVTTWIMLIYLRFNYAVSISDYMVLNSRMINE